MNPQQQKQFSSWWLDEKYGGDFNNVDGLYQNEVTGAWQGDPNRIFDINPETGQKGQFRYMATPAVTGWMDVTPDLYGEYTNVGEGGRVKMIRNRHGLYSPEESYYDPGNGLVERYKFTVNPNTGEEGKWIWLGTMGWVNTEGDPQPEPEPGTIIFGGSGQIAGPYNPAIDNPNGDAYSGGSTDTSTNTGNNNGGDISTGVDQSTNPTDTMLSPVNNPNAIGSSWLDVLNRQGRDLDSWDGFLGAFTGLDQNPDWTQMNRNQVQDDFNNIWDQGLFSGLSQNQVYADLLKRLGFA